MGGMNMDDDKIIELFHRRDEQAIKETEARYGDYCRSISGKILNSKEDVDECVQDAYLKLWDTIPPEEPKNLKAYLGSIVRNISINRLKKQNAGKRGKNSDLLLSELEDCIPSQNEVESAVNMIILGELLDKWLEKEKPAHRRLFLGRYLHGYEYSELSEIFRESESTLMLRLHRMRKKLKKYLEKEGISV